MEIKVGQVTAKGKLHLSLNGLAYCGSGTGRTINTEALAGTNNLCKRCAVKIRATLDDRLNTAAVSQREHHEVSELRYQLRSTEEIAEDARMVDDIWATLTDRWAEPEEPTWAQRQARVAALLEP